MTKDKGEFFRVSVSKRTHVSGNSKSPRVRYAYTLRRGKKLYLKPHDVNDIIPSQPMIYISSDQLNGELRAHRFLAIGTELKFTANCRLLRRTETK